MDMTKHNKMYLKYWYFNKVKKLLGEAGYNSSECKNSSAYSAKTGKQVSGTITNFPPCLDSTVSELQG